MGPRVSLGSPKKKFLLFQELNLGCPDHSPITAALHLARFSHIYLFSQLDIQFQYLKSAISVLYLFHLRFFFSP
jgi:hypothetical protein